MSGDPIDDDLFLLATHAMMMTIVVWKHREMMTIYFLGTHETMTIVG